MSINKTRKKNSRFYWAELGFLALGLVGLNPSLLTDLLVGSTVPAPQNLPTQPLFGYPAAGSVPPGSYQGYPFPSNAWNAAHSGYPPAAFYPPTHYTNSQPTASLFSEPDVQLLASRVGEYLTGTASHWLGSQQNTSAAQDLRPSTAGLGNPYTSSYPNYHNSGQFGAVLGYGTGWQTNPTANGVPTTVPPPSYSVPNTVPFPSTAGATYSAQLPSGAAAYGNPAASVGLVNPQPNLVRGYSSNYQTLANPGSFVPAGSTANVLQQRQTQSSLPVVAPSTNGGWTSPMIPASTPATNGYYGRY